MRQVLVTHSQLVFVRNRHARSNELWPVSLYRSMYIPCRSSFTKIYLNITDPLYLQRFTIFSRRPNLATYSMPRNMQVGTRHLMHLFQNGSWNWPGGELVRHELWNLTHRRCLWHCYKLLYKIYNHNSQFETSKYCNCHCPEGQPRAILYITIVHPLYST